MTAARMTRQRSTGTDPGREIPAGTVFDLGGYTWEATETTQDGPVSARVVPGRNYPDHLIEVVGSTAVLGRKDVLRDIDQGEERTVDKTDHDEWVRSLVPGTVLHQDRYFDNWVRGVALGDGTWRPTALVGEWLAFTRPDGSVGYDVHKTEEILAGKPGPVESWAHWWGRDGRVRDDPAGLPELPLTPWPSPPVREWDPADTALCARAAAVLTDPDLSPRTRAARARRSLWPLGPKKP